jgi:hypothetical protein
MVDRFSAEVARRIGHYVYRLIDPRNGETFYVGRGEGDRVFQHARNAWKPQGNASDNVPAKSQRIAAIRAAGFEVAHVIHRHGLTAKEAHEVEAALIDAYPGLTNLVSGAGTARGVMHADEVITQYEAPEAAWRHSMVLIKVNGSLLDKPDIYEACRYAWKLSRARAEKAEFVVAAYRGVIRGVFRPVKWLNATITNFPGREEMPHRIGFEGVDAPEDVRVLYLGCAVPQAQRKKGSASPALYVGP